MTYCDDGYDYYYSYNSVYSDWLNENLNSWNAPTTTSTPIPTTTTNTTTTINNNNNNNNFQLNDKEQTDYLYDDATYLGLPLTYDLVNENQEFSHYGSAESSQSNQPNSPAIPNIYSYSYPWCDNFYDNYCCNSQSDYEDLRGTNLCNDDFLYPPTNYYHHDKILLADNNNNNNDNNNNNNSAFDPTQETQMLDTRLLSEAIFESLDAFSCHSNEIITEESILGELEEFVNESRNNIKETCHVILLKHKNKQIDYKNKNNNNDNNNHNNNHNHNCRGTKSRNSNTQQVCETSRNLPLNSVAILRNWLLNNLTYPYPDEETKNELCELSNLNIKQLNYWFVNARRRFLKKYQNKFEIE